MTTNRSIAAMIAALLGLFGVRFADAASCATGCARRMAACRAERCADLSQQACRDRCRTVTGCRAGGARTQTLANVVTECSSAGGAWTAEQRLEIKRGDCAPTVVMRLAGTGAVRDIGLCRLYGTFRVGATAVTIAPLQRLGVSPDGRRIIFEITTANAVFPGPRFEVPEEGIFTVHADGSRLRRLGPASLAKPYKGPITPYAYPPGFNLLVTPKFDFSPNGRFVVFLDRGRGSDGTDAGQLVVMDTLSGKRKQVTEFSATTQSPPAGADVAGVFVDDDTISGASLRIAGDATSSWQGLFLVHRDGSDFHFFIPPTQLSGSHVVENFQVTGGHGDAVTLALSSPAVEPDAGAVSEVFFRDGAELLQLTKLGRSDTYGGAPARDGQRVFFEASANPFDRNPSNNCQLFSIGSLGDQRGLRQLTRFDPVMPSDYGCARNAAPPACTVAGEILQVDPVTGSVVFDWTCDPFGLNPISSQMFAMRPDGSGLRQLTNYGGMREGADGTLSVELPGPISYSARDHSVGRSRRTSPR